jgi:hypothetical protein
MFRVLESKEIDGSSSSSCSSSSYSSSSTKSLKDFNFDLLNCVICEKQTIDPQVCIRGCFLFCKKCISDIKSDICSLCQQPKNFVSLFESSHQKFAQELLKPVRVGCLKCKWQDSILFLNNHNLKYCPLRNVNCEFCKEMLTFDKLETHKKESCLEAKISCLECKGDIIRKDLESHRQNHCSKRIVSCDLCQEKISFQNIGKHRQEDCLLTLVVCMICNFKGTRKEFIEKHSTDSDIINTHVKRLAIQQNMPKEQYEQKHNTINALNLSTMTNLKFGTLFFSHNCTLCDKTHLFGDAVFSNSKSVYCIDCAWTQHTIYNNKLVDQSNACIGGFIKTKDSAEIFKIGKFTQYGFQVETMTNETDRITTYSSKTWFYI